MIPAGPTEEDKAKDFLGGKNWCRKCSLGWFVHGSQVNLVRFRDAFQIQKILQQSMLHSEKTGLHQISIQGGIFGRLFEEAFVVVKAPPAPSE